MKQAQRTQCTVCRHPQLKRIERAIVLKSHTLAEIADAFGVSVYAVERHKANHMSTDRRNRVFAEAREEQDAIEGNTAAQIVHAEKLDVFATITKLSRRCEAIFDRFEAEGNDAGALSALRELRHQTALFAKILADLDHSREQSLTIDENHPAWLAVRDKVFRVLSRHPAALADFIETFGERAYGSPRLAQ